MQRDCAMLASKTRSTCAAGKQLRSCMGVGALVGSSQLTGLIGICDQMRPEDDVAWMDVVNELHDERRGIERKCKVSSANTDNDIEIRFVYSTMETI